ncbi:MAG: type II secretion system protein [Sulfuricurvum sp.]|nr:type II secretion system protein [Sulfuricurvum sp.]
MKRSAFTLVELIFTIVIIGVLAAVAVPNFKNLKQNAEVKAMVKTTIDTASSAASAAVNAIDLEDGNASDTNLSNLVDVKGKGWSYVQGTTGTGTYTYTDKANNKAVSHVIFSGPGRQVHYDINCTGFQDTTSKNKCYADTNTTSTTIVDKNITF